jgi:hypothetical protein
MKTRTKIALTAAAVIASTALYGNIRFNFSRYEPQCEQLPGVTIYGKPPQISEIQMGDWARSVGPMGVNLRLLYGGKWADITATYDGDVKQLRLIGTSYDGNGYSDYTPHAPLQVVTGILKRPVVKGCWRYDAAYLGLREIFETPKFIAVNVANAHLPSLPPRHYRPKWGGRDNEPRQLYDTLRVLSQKLHGYAQWRAKMAGERLASELNSKKPGTYLKIYNEEARALISEIESMRPPPAGKPFWRGWDILFGAGIASMLGLFVSGLFKRNKPAEDFIEIQGWAEPTPQKNGDEMDDKEKKRRELEALYHKTMKGLYERIESATTREECRSIRTDFWALSDKLIAEDPELYKSFRKENTRFHAAVDWKTEVLGGPKAILR